MRTQTHIETIRQNYISNQVLIQAALGLSTTEYQMFLFETGCFFLEDTYPESMGLLEHYKIASRDANFWTWWCSEWKLWEQELLDHLNFNNRRLSKKTYETEMKQIAWDKQISISYDFNYLKFNIKKFNRSHFKN